jgi:hypothetical protein
LKALNHPTPLLKQPTLLFPHAHPRKKTLKKHKKILPNLSTLLPSPFGKGKKIGGKTTAFQPTPIHPT